MKIASHNVLRLRQCALEESREARKQDDDELTKDEDKNTIDFRCSALARPIMFLGACAKKAAPPPPPPPPALTAPTASLSANPNTLDPGQPTTLTWQTTNATDVSIDGIGPVDPSGSRQVTPADSTTYHLIAKGAGGTQDATARVTVNAAAAPPQQLLTPPKKNSSRKT